MIDAATALDHVRHAGDRIAHVAHGKLDRPVPSCPGMDVASLLLHTGGFCRWASDVLVAKALPEVDWDDIGDDPLDWHIRMHARLVEELAERDPDDETWSWGSDQHVRFWYRRAAHELSVHRWDAEGATDGALPIEAHLAADGIDEFLDEFGPSREGWAGGRAAEKFGGDGETLHLHATDLGDGAGEWLVTCRPDRFEVAREHGKGDVALRGNSSDLLLFLWGRVPASRFEVFGDTSLLERWHDRVRI